MEDFIGILSGFEFKDLVDGFIEFFFFVIFFEFFEFFFVVVVVVIGGGNLSGFEFKGSEPAETHQPQQAAHASRHSRSPQTRQQEDGAR